MIEISKNIKEKVGLADYLSIGIGGPARFFIEAKSRQDIIDAVNWAKDKGMKYILLGGGSNCIASDEGFDGLIILNRSNSVIFRSDEVEVESGYVLLKLLLDAAKQNLGGLESLAGIPGTVGGAVRANAGAYGGEIKDFLIKAEVLKEDGSIVWMSNRQLEMSYRHSMLKDNPSWIVLRVLLRFEGMKGVTAENAIRSILNKRNESFPKGRSAGCFFKNPTPSSSAGMLIDRCGLKGYTVGGILVSLDHANYLINDNNGTCRDAMRMVEFIKREVRSSFKFDLNLEVSVIGELPELKEEDIPKRVAEVF